MNIRFLSLVLLLSVVQDSICTGNFHQVECDIVAIDSSAMHNSRPHIPAPSSVRTTSPSQTLSLNWAGYSAYSKLANKVRNSVSAVFGAWTVPTLVPTPDNSYCAVWVGIDGFNSSSVEQIGTAHNYSNGTQQDYAWFEMYPGAAYALNGFPVNPGDNISASVVYLGNFVFQLTIYNNTQHRYFVVPTHYTKSKTAARSCAEWVVEAPYLNGILPLSDFGTEIFTQCRAVINGVSAFLNNPSWSHIAVEMVTQNGTVKALPSPIFSNNSSFSVTWAHE